MNKNTISNQELESKILSGERIDSTEARHLFGWDILTLGRLADERREQIRPGNEVGFILDRIINFTNRCEAECRFCAFHSKAGQREVVELGKEEILGKVAELVRNGGTQVMLQGGLHPDYNLATYVQLIRSVKHAFPQVYLHSFSPAEAVHMAAKSGRTIDQVIAILKDAGLDSMPGASDLLVDRIRSKASPNKLTTEQWREVMDALHRHGLKSSATMTYGMGETLEERIEHLGVVRDIQDKSGIIRAFIPWSFSPSMTEMDDIPPATGVDYLKIVAIARIFLDNVVHIQAGWLTEGMKLAQVALAMGANDMGGVLMEEQVVRATGVETRTNRDELIDLIRNAGKVPVQRDSEYKVIRGF
ncbi:MAG: CofH family radical SAM protein [Deltaproteobacteria bacterium]|nr:CofH family radical SAM protein [Deltaproteobacteria bacterium]